jgi:hypothetical protein
MIGPERSFLIDELIQMLAAIRHSWRAVLRRDTARGAGAGTSKEAAMWPEWQIRLVAADMARN